MKQVTLPEMSQWEYETILFSLDQTLQRWEKEDKKDGIESPGVETIKNLLRKLGGVA